MKNILKTLITIITVFSLISCEKETVFGGTPDIELTPVYSISGLTSLFKLDIYLEKTFLLEYTVEDKVSKSGIKDLIDNSTETNFDVTLTKLVPKTQEDGSIIFEEILYSLNGDKSTGLGTLTIGTEINNNINILQTELYN